MAYKPGSACWYAAAFNGAMTSPPDPLDHRVLSNRSRALLVMGHAQEALKDAEECCSLKLLWPKVGLCLGNPGGRLIDSSFIAVMVIGHIPHDTTSV